MYHKLPLDKRIELYNEAFVLRKSGLSPRAIERRFKSIHGYSVDAVSINKWVYHGARPDTRANIPDLNPSPQLSYFLGAYMGDGCKYCNTKRRVFRICFRVKDRDFAEHASSAIAFVLGRSPVHPWTTKGHGGPNDIFHIFTVESWSMRSFLGQSLETQLAAALSFPREFLRGIFDAEGFVSVGRLRNCLQVYVGIAMSNRMIIDAVRRILLVEFGIPTVGPYQKKGRPIMIQGHVAIFKRTTYEVRVTTRAGVEKFAKLVGFSIRRKNQKLMEVVNLLRASASRNALAIWEKRHDQKPSRMQARSRSATLVTSWNPEIKFG